MEAMMTGPGGMEWVMVLIVGLFAWGIPIAVVVWLIITLNGIRRDVAAIRQRLEASQQ